jgi:hypothetical protein
MRSTQRHFLSGVLLGTCNCEFSEGEKEQGCWRLRVLGCAGQGAAPPVALSAANRKCFVCEAAAPTSLKFWTQEGPCLKYQGYITSPADMWCEPAPHTSCKHNNRLHLQVAAVPETVSNSMQRREQQTLGPQTDHYATHCPDCPVELLHGKNNTAQCCQLSTPPKQPEFQASTQHM